MAKPVTIPEHLLPRGPRLWGPPRDASEQANDLNGGSFAAFFVLFLLMIQYPLRPALVILETGHPLQPSDHQAFLRNTLIQLIVWIGLMLSQAIRPTVTASSLMLVMYLSLLAERWINNSVLSYVQIGLAIGVVEGLVLGVRASWYEPEQRRS